MRSDLPQVEAMTVDRMVITPHKSKAGNHQIKVMYHCGLRMFTEYVNLESPAPFVRHKAHNWWKQRHHWEPPETNAQALSIANELRTPRVIHVWVNRPNPEIQSAEF